MASIIIPVDEDYIEFEKKFALGLKAYLHDILTESGFKKKNLYQKFQILTMLKRLINELSFELSARIAETILKDLSKRI